MSDDNVYMAKLAEQAERYEEMVEYMKAVATASPASEDLSLEERNLLSVAYKNVVGARRASLRIIGSIEAKERSKPENTKAEVIGGYKAKVEQELNSICNDILALLDANLIKDSLESEPKVFYQKMKVAPPAAATPAPLPRRISLSPAPPHSPPAPPRRWCSWCAAAP